MHLLEFLHNQSKYIKLLVVGAIESQLNFNKSRKMSSNIDQFEKQTMNTYFEDGHLVYCKLFIYSCALMGVML